MFRSYYWLVHLAIIVAGAYFAADIVNLRLGSYLEGFLESPEGASVFRPDRRTTPIEEAPKNYQLILKRNIFNSKARAPSPTGSLPSQQAPAQVIPASLPPLDVTLVGTVVSKDSLPFAVFIEAKNKEQTIYRQGDTIGNEARILEINRNNTVVLRGQQKEVIELKLDPNKGQRKARPIARRVSPPTPKAIPSDTIRQISDNQWLLDRREIDSALKNLPQLLTKARIIPNFKDGKPDGFRIFAIAKGSLYSKIGLQNGDILNRINGVEVKDPQNFMKVLEQLKDENSIHIDLVRNNQKQTFDYDIR